MNCRFEDNADHMGKQSLWKGEPNRPLAMYRPCRCGCDYRNGLLGVGYLSASDDDGNGFTIWIQNERIYTQIKLALRQARRAKRVR